MLSFWGRLPGMISAARTSRPTASGGDRYQPTHRRAPLLRPLPRGCQCGLLLGPVLGSRALCDDVELGDAVEEDDKAGHDGHDLGADRGEQHDQQTDGHDDQCADDRPSGGLGATGREADRRSGVIADVHLGQEGTGRGHEEPTHHADGDEPQRQRLAEHGQGGADHGTLERGVVHEEPRDVQPEDDQSEEACDDQKHPAEADDGQAPLRGQPDAKRHQRQGDQRDHPGKGGHRLDHRDDLAGNPLLATDLGQGEVQVGRDDVGRLGNELLEGRRGRCPQICELQDRRVTALLGHRIVERSDRGGEDAVEQRAACDRSSPGGDGRLDCDQVRLGIERCHGNGLADLGLDRFVLADLVHQPGEVLAIDDSGVQPSEYPGHEQADRAQREQHLRPGVAAPLAHDVLPEGCVRAPLWPARVSSAATSFC